MLNWCVQKSMIFLEPNLPHRPLNPHLQPLHYPHNLLSLLHILSKREVEVNLRFCSTRSNADLAAVG